MIYYLCTMLRATTPWQATERQDRCKQLPDILTFKAFIFFQVVVELPKITLNEDMSRVPVPQCVTAVNPPVICEISAPQNTTKKQT